MSSRRPVVVLVVIGLGLLALWIGTSAGTDVPKPVAPAVSAEAPVAAASPVPQTAEPAPAIEAAPALERFEPGRWFRYDFDRRQTVRMVHDHGDQTAKFSAEGQVTFVVVAAKPDRVTLETSLTLREISSESHAPGALDGIRKGLEAPFFLHLAPDGGTQDLSMRTGLPEGTATMARGLVLDFPVPLEADETRWTRKQFDATGEFEATFERRDAGSDGWNVVRSFERYSKVFGAALSQSSGEGTATYRFGSVPGWPERIEVAQKLAVKAGFSVTATVSAGYVLREHGYDPGRVRPPDEGGKIEATGPDDVASRDAENRRARARMDRDLTKGHTVSSVLSELRNAPAELVGEAANRASSRLNALLRLDPARASEIAEAILADPASDHVGVLASALGSAGVATGPPALIALLRDLGPEHERARDLVMMSLGTSEPPTPEALAALSESAPNDPSESTRLLARGAMANLLAESDPEAARDTVDDLAEQAEAATDEAELITLLSALGNSGDPRALELAQKHRNDAAHWVRAAAVYAVRLVPGEVAEALIVQVMSTDREALVRRRAIEAAGYRPLSVFADAIVNAMQTDRAADIRRLAVQRLAGDHEVARAYLAALRQTAQGDASDRVRMAAAALVTQLDADKGASQ